MSNELNISIIGLPESGKTTFLAALWHMVREGGVVTKLKFANLQQGNYEHLNALVRLWRAGKIQQRTQTGGMKTVIMRLKNTSGREVNISFPDVPGEDFSAMWEKREVDEGIREILTAPAIVLIINGDTIKFPAWIAERNTIARRVGLPVEQSEPVDWSASLAPTQVRLVALLQFLMSGDLNVGPRRLAVVMSAWDRVEGEQKTPEQLLASSLPLLDQYLRNGRDPWEWQVWGVSAQGGVYEDPEKDQHFETTAALRDLDRASDRIKVLRDSTVTTDITLPLEWLIA